VRETTVPTLTLSDVFALAGEREIHWLKIDVEGMEKQVLEGWGNHPKRPWIVVVEATLPNTTIESHQEWEQHVLTLGYHYAYKDGLSRFYVHEGHSALCKKLILPPNVFQIATIRERILISELVPKPLIYPESNVQKKT
jgi:hypothetical protein